MSSRIGGGPALPSGPAPSAFPQAAPDDAALVRAALADPAAFRAIVERYQDAIYDLCLRMLGQRQDAEDAAQDAFVALYRTLARYDPSHKLSNWLYTIALNRCRRQLRRRRVLRFFSLDDGGPEREAPSEPASEDRPLDAGLEIEEGAEWARRAIDSLPDTLRGAFVLRHVKKMSYREIAEALRLPMSNVKVRLHRAKLFLWKRFGKKSM